VDAESDIERMQEIAANFARRNLRATSPPITTAPGSFADVDQANDVLAAIEVF
jgi:hypothetical protein